MVPSSFEVLDELPLTPVGKVDRKALAKREFRPADQQWEAPQTPMEELVAGAWAEVLELERVGRRDHFFELGGHSLLATRAVSRLNQALGIEMPLRQLFESPRLEELARYIEQALQQSSGRSLPPLRPVSRDQELPLSFAQQRLWFLDQMDPGSSAYNIPTALHFEGVLDAAALQAALQAIVQRHEALRTVFPSHKGNPVQRISDVPSNLLPQADLRGLDNIPRHSELRRLAQQESDRPFDLARGPLLRVLLVHLEEGQQALLACMHHIISDGWSMEILTRELSRLYQFAVRSSQFAVWGAEGEKLESENRELRTANRELPLPPLPIQYADFAAWQRGWLRGEVLQAELDHWRRRLEGTQPLDLPSDRPRPPQPSLRGAKLRFGWQGRLGNKLKELSRSQDTTLYMTLLALFQSLLHRYSGQEDISTGSPIANRNRPETEGLIGFFVNTLVLRSDLSGEPGFAQVLARVRQTALDAYAHQDVPFELLVERLQPERSLNRTPLFQVMFTLQNLSLGGARAEGLGAVLVRPVEVESATAKFDLTVSMGESSRGLTGTVEYSTDLFDAPTIGRMLMHLENLARAAAEDPERQIAALSILSEAERHQLQEWNPPASEQDLEGLWALFQEQVRRRPEAVAAIFDEKYLSYGELDRRSGRVSAALRAAGVSTEGLIGVLCQRSLAMIEAFAGILRAGAAYLPLDADYPAERLSLMLQDAGAQAVLAQSELLDRLPADTPRPLLLGSLPEADEGLTAPDDAARLAYVIYTSGSTGIPKGVAVTCGAVVSLVRQAGYIALDEGSRVAQAASSSFDAITFELWGPLLNGGTLLGVPRDTLLSPSEFAALLQDESVSDLFLTTALFNQVAAHQPEAFSGLSNLLFGGESVDPRWVRRVLQEGPPRRLLHVYGPTECTTFASGGLISQVDPRSGNVPIGHSLAGRTLYVLDRRFSRVPIGIPGELCIGGDGLARGYLKRPALTAESFVPHPFETGQRLYRTGDLVRWTQQGLEFLGRLDDQVKIRGFRIEPGEVEALLSAHPEVESCAVLAVEGEQGRRLVAYVVGREAEGRNRRERREAVRRTRRSQSDAEKSSQRPLRSPSASSAVSPPLLSSFLGQRLPAYMVPSAFVMLDEIPLTPNGKVDRRALLKTPLPEASGEESRAPSSPVEELLAGIWCDLLGRQSVGADENFFELGGHSLLATQVISRLRSAFEVELPLRALFEAPSVAGLARKVEEARRVQSAPAPPLRPVERPRGGSGLPLSYAQQRLWFLDQLDRGAARYNVPQAIRLPGEVAPAAMQAALDALVARHEVLRTTFPARDGKPVQVIHSRLRIPLNVIDMRACPGKQSETEVARLRAQEALRPFDLAQGPLLRMTIVLQKESGVRIQDSGRGEKKVRGSQFAVRSSQTAARTSAPDSSASGTYSLQPTAYSLLLTLHHIISDGWSMGVLRRELQAFYQCFSDLEPGTRNLAPEALPPLPIQYADFASWQREWLAGGELQQQIGYWKERLSGAAVLELPADRPPTALESARGAVLRFAWPGRLVEDLRQLSRAHDATLYMTLLAAFQALLFRHTGQDDVSVGSPIANRNRAETEGLIGFFVNTLVMRSGVSGRIGFDRLLGRVRETALGAFAHQDVPFEQVVEAVQPERSLSRTPLFQVMFVLQNAAGAPPTLDVPDEADEGQPQWSLHPALAKFDLTLALAETSTGLGGAAEFSTDLFDPTTIRRLLVHFRRMLEGLVQDPARRIGDIPLLGPAEQQQMVVEFNATHADYPSHQTIHGQLEETAERWPDRTALSSGDSMLSYAELMRLGGRLAGFLQRQGVKPDSLVGVSLDRSLEMVGVLVGILKSGAAYLPLDPNYPEERLAWMLEDSAASLVLTQQRHASQLPSYSARLVVLEEQSAEILGDSGEPAMPKPEQAGDPLSRAYVIYTSGSTGRPKGVEVCHRSVLRLACRSNYAQLDPDQVFLQLAPVSFDASTFELWASLLNGARLGVFPPAQPSLEDLGHELERLQVTTLWLTAPLFHLMADRNPEPLYRLRQLLAGGDVLSPPHVQRMLAGGTGRLINGYGPTECTTFACCQVIEQFDSAWRSIPIGPPILNTDVLVVDSELNPVPLGSPGELLLGGDGLARGYLNQPRLTAERFIPHPFATKRVGQRLYRTGDLVRWQRTATIEFLGRMDQQVKIRGFRVEPGEIESVLGEHPAVSQSAVVVRADAAGLKQLVAFVSSDWDPQPTPAELQGFLEAQLPDFMRPSLIQVMEALPLTPSGKIDRKALPETAAAQTVEYQPPRTPTERRLAQIWKQVLGIERAGLGDNFFGLGGHSLSATQAASLVRQSFGVDLPLRSFFETPRLGELAQRIEELWMSERQGPASPLVPLQPQGDCPPFFCVHPAGGGIFGYLELAGLMAPDQPFYALQAPDLEGSGEPCDSVEELAKTYLEAVRQVQPSGPYFLGGHSFGGVVAFEMTRQFLEAGDEVGLLALIDSSPIPGDKDPESSGTSLLQSFALYLGLALADFDLKELLSLETDEQLSRILERAQERGLVEPGMQSDQFKRLFRILQAHVQAGWDYTPQPIPVRAVLFRAEDALDPAISKFRKNAAALQQQGSEWAELTTAGMRLESIPGHHFSMLRKPNVQVLAERLLAALAGETRTKKPDRKN